MAFELECPVDFVPMNENKARITAVFIFAISTTYLFVPHWFIAAFLVLDFLTRCFLNPAYSVLNIISTFIEKIAHVQYKATDKGDKKFAALVGFILSDVILLTTIFQLQEVALLAASLICFFSFLEAVFGFCAGCHVYTLLSKIPIFR